MKRTLQKFRKDSHNYRSTELTLISLTTPIPLRRICVKLKN